MLPPGRVLATVQADVVDPAELFATIWYMYSTHINTNLFQPHTHTHTYTSSSSLLLHVSCVISSQFSLLDPLNHPHWSLFSNHQLTPVSTSLTTPSSIPHLTCVTIFLLLFISSSSSSFPSSCSDPGSLVNISHRFSTLILKTPFVKVFPSIATSPLLRVTFWNITTRCLTVTGGGNVG